MLLIIIALIFVFYIFNQAKKNNIKTVSEVETEITKEVQKLESQIQDLGLPIAEQEKLTEMQFDFSQLGNEIHNSVIPLNNQNNLPASTSPYQTDYTPSPTQQIINAIGGGGGNAAVFMSEPTTNDYFN